LGSKAEDASRIQRIDQSTISDLVVLVKNRTEKEFLWIVSISLSVTQQIRYLQQQYRYLHNIMVIVKQQTRCHGK